MFPIRDDNPQFDTPYATVGIIVLNVLAWGFLQQWGGQPGLTSSVCSLGLLPGELLHTLPAGYAVPVGHGANCVLEAEPNFATLFTHMFLHGGWMHLLGNLWFLWIFGGNVEDAMGSTRFAVFYLLCGLAAAAAQMVSNPDSALPMVGASGAIGGVMGAYVMLYPRVSVHMLFWFGLYVTTFAIPAMWMLGYWFLVQAVGGLMASGEGGGTAFWAHVGGFVAGAALVGAFRVPALLARHPHVGWAGVSGPAWRRLR